MVNKLNRYDTLEGFGAAHTAAQWAELLDIPFRILQYYVKSERLSVEQIYARYGYRYQAPKPKTRKPRMGRHMIQTQERMYWLLLLSGYIGPDDDRECVSVESVGTNRNHRVLFKGNLVGVYNYETCSLRLNGGDILPLWKLELEDARIRQGPTGLWVTHPETRRLLAPAQTWTDSEEIQPSEYDYIVAKHRTR